MAFVITEYVDKFFSQDLIALVLHKTNLIAYTYVKAHF